MTILQGVGSSRSKRRYELGREPTLTRIGPQSSRKKGQDIIYYLIDPEKNDAPPAVDCNSYYYSLWVLKGVF